MSEELNEIERLESEIERLKEIVISMKLDVFMKVNMMSGVEYKWIVLYDRLDCFEMSIVCYGDEEKCDEYLREKIVDLMSRMSELDFKVSELGIEELGGGFRFVKLIVDVDDSGSRVVDENEIKFQLVISWLKGGDVVFFF